MPCRPAGQTASRRALLRAGFALDAALTPDRNTGVRDRLRLPAGRIVDGEDRVGLDTGTLLGDGPVGVWHDYCTTHAERLTFGVAIAAVRAGAVLANYVDAIEPIRQGRTIAGVIARDHVNGAELTDRRTRAAQRHRRERRPVDGRASVCDSRRRSSRP